MNELLTWFGLKRQPFDKGIKASTAIETTPLNEALARLDYIRQRGGMMLFTGDPGVGKTLALRRFADSLSETRYRTVYTPLTTLRGTDVLRHLSHLLGLRNQSSKATLFQQLQQEILDSHEQKGRTVVLLIDEAQLLQTPALHELRLLTNFKMDSFDPFVLVLAGQSELRRLFEYAVMEPFAQRFGMRYHMPPLEPKETVVYLQKHLQLAGAHDPIFHDDAFRALHEASFGLPRRLGSLATQVLQYAVFAEKRTIDADLVLHALKGQ